MDLAGWMGIALGLSFAWASRSEASDVPASYREAILSEEGLAAYWPMEGDLADAMRRTPGRMARGEARFVDGPGTGRALELGEGQFVTMGPTPHLDLPETTVELLFKITAEPRGSYNPCLIAKRGPESGRTRFSIHVRRDLRWLDLWNGREVIAVEFPAGPIEIGAWHHVAVAADGKGAAFTIDGVRCASQAGGTFGFSARDLPLQIGASTATGDEPCPCAVDEVAIYSRVLGKEDIARHLKALGWEGRVDELLRRRRGREAAQARRRDERRARRLNDPRLFARGRTRVYRGANLTGISLPLGGIGAGCIQIDGEAVRHSWQIFNNFAGVFVPHSFFAVRAAARGGEPVVRALQTQAVGPFRAVKALSFRGEYPFGWYAFEDPDLPAAVGMETFSPLIPLRARDSAIPCAIFRLTARNTGRVPVAVRFLAAQQNAVGCTGKAKIDGRAFDGYGGNVNRIARRGGATILHMTAEREGAGPGGGDMALAAVAEGASGTASWESLASLREDFEGPGLHGPRHAGPSPEAGTIDGALAVDLLLQPGEARTVPFILAWHFPHVRHGARAWGGEGNRYAVWWPSALDVAAEVVERLDELTRLTRLYHDTFYAGNLPHWLLDRITSQVAVLRSKTCFWTRDGYFGGWEGCNPGGGCCHGNCAHVWHYAQAHARLFPSIARRMREQALGHQAEDGGIPFRQPRGAVATDGQCGEILEAYREHLTSVDGAWLARHWPRIRKAMEYTIRRWDPDEDGVLSGPQHNTLDASLGGSTTWLGSMYLAALAASEKMALLEGEADAAARFRRIREAGSAKQNETLWNGEYYIQIPDARSYRDFLTGCDVDQMLGQWWARQLDLGWLYPPDRVRTALRSLFTYNFRADFHGFRQSPRTFVAPDDAGLLDMTWPRGGRPAPGRCILYADEVQSGYEAAAFVAMVQAGLLREGFAAALAAADRYDGRLRTGMSGAAWGYSGNPFGDDECGKFYARSMSIWSMLLACQGFIHDGPAGRIGFKPVWKPEDHASFFTAAEGWGLFRQRREDGAQAEEIAPAYGRLRIRELVFELPDAAGRCRVIARVGDREVPVRARTRDRELLLDLAEPVVLEAGSRLLVRATWGGGSGLRPRGMRRASP